MDVERPKAKGKIYDHAKVLERTELETDALTFIGDFSFISCKYLKMAKGSHINQYVLINGRGRVFLGEYSVIASHAQLLTSTDTPWGRMSDFAPEEDRRIKTADITIGKECFVSGYASILPGVTIGDGSFIGMYSHIKPNMEIPKGSMVKPKGAGIIVSKRKVDIAELVAEERMKVFNASQEEEEL